MYVELNNKRYAVDNSLNGGFEPKVSQLRKNNKSQLEVSLYVDSQDCNDFVFFERLSELPNILYLTNQYYWWIFENVYLKKKIITEDLLYKKLFVAYKNKYSEQRRFKISLEFTYSNIYGTTDRISFDRELLIKNILK